MILISRRISSRISIFTIVSLGIIGCLFIRYFIFNSTNLHRDSIQPSVLLNNDTHLKAAFVNRFGRLQSALSPQLEWCTSNPFLRYYNQSAVLELELRWFKWNLNELSTAYNILMEYAVSPGDGTGDIVYLAYPDSLPLPCPYNGGLTRYGGSDDGGKTLCGFESLEPLSKCIIYSLGSGGHFKFELDILSKTSCEIYTYDCTHPGPDKPINGLTYHKICMGEASNLQTFMYSNNKEKRNDALNNSSAFRLYHQIVDDNNHTHVHLLKMDIEGGEYSVFADLFTYPSKSNLPYQISFESHWWNRDIYHATLHQQMFKQLWKYGYRFMQHELNEGDNSCVEWTLMRVFC